MRKAFRTEIFPSDSSCVVNVLFSDSKPKINGFRVYVENGSVKVRLPWKLEGVWPYEDVPYSEVEETIINDVLKETVKVSLIRIDDNNFTADVTLPVTGTLIRNFQVCADESGLYIIKPDHLGDTWLDNEMPYEKTQSLIYPLICRQIINEYARVTFRRTKKGELIASFSLSCANIAERNIRVFRNESGQMELRSFDRKHPWCKRYFIDAAVKNGYYEYVQRRKEDPLLNGPVSLDEAELRRLCCYFEKKGTINEERYVEITLTATGETYTGVYTVYNNKMRYDKDQRFNYNAEKLNEKVSMEYKRQILGEEVPDIYENMQADIRFGEPYSVYGCNVYVEFPESEYRDEGFYYLIKDMSEGGGGQIISPKVKKNFVNLPVFYEILKEEYYKKKSEIVFEESKEYEKPAEDKIVLDKNEIRTFSFTPQTILRLDKNIDKKDSSDERSGIWQAVMALNNGPEKGGIGMLEINMLSWIRRLRFVTDTMLMWILEMGYIAKGWRNINSTANFERLDRMAELDLIYRTHFVKVDDMGNLLECCRNPRIVSIGATGGVLLRQFESDNIHMESRNLMQPGNAVKRYLAANLWLLYWLKNYKNEIGENYETSYVAVQKGAEVSTKARLYASVTINGKTLIAEPVRRSEKFEVTARNEEHKRKLKRIINLYRDPEQIYVENQKISFENRPIIVMVCEDAEHIFEVWEYVKECLEDDPDQIIWFTADLWLYGDDNRGNRFFQFDNNKLVRADLMKYIGIDKENSPALSAQR